MVRVLALPSSQPKASRHGTSLALIGAILFVLPAQALAAPCGGVPETKWTAPRDRPSRKNYVSPYQSRSDEDRRKLQWALIWSGAYSGEVNGVMGPSTELAIKQSGAAVYGARKLDEPVLH